MRNNGIVALFTGFVLFACSVTTTAPPSATGAGTTAPPATAASSCGSVCDHIASVCRPAPLGCADACAGWTDEARGCAGAATGCNALQECAAEKAPAAPETAPDSGRTSSGSTEHCHPPQVAPMGPHGSLECGGRCEHASLNNGKDWCSFSCTADADCNAGSSKFDYKCKSALGICMKRCSNDDECKAIGLDTCNFDGMCL